MRRAGVDRSGGGILRPGWIRSLFEADVGPGPPWIAGAAEHRVLGIDRRQVELALGQMQVASPDEAEQRGMRGFVSDRLAARRAPLEELLDIFGDVADGRLPVVEEDLHVHGLRIGPDELRLRASLCAHAPAGRIPLRTLLHGVLARVELEVQPADTVDLFELRFDHLHRKSLLLSTKKSVVGEFQGLSGRLVGADVERGPIPAHRKNTFEVPRCDRCALGIKGGDLRGLPLDLEFELRHPVRDLLRVFVNRAGELDVLVLGASGNPVDEGVLAALLVLENVIFDGKAVALRPVAEIAVTIDLDSEPQALSVGLLCHCFLLSAGRSAIRPAPDRSATPSSTGYGSGRRVFQRAHPCRARPLVGGLTMTPRRRPPTSPPRWRQCRPMTSRSRPGCRLRRRLSRTRSLAWSTRTARPARRPARSSDPQGPGLPVVPRCRAAALMAGRGCDSTRFPFRLVGERQDRTLPSTGRARRRPGDTPARRVRRRPRARDRPEYVGLAPALEAGPAFRGRWNGVRRTNRRSRRSPRRNVRPRRWIPVVVRGRR